MNSKVTALCLGILVAASLHADWKSNVAYATGGVCLVSSYNLYKKSEQIHAAMNQPCKSFHASFNQTALGKERLAHRIAACCSFMVGAALITFAYLRKPSNNSTQK